VDDLAGHGVGRHRNGNGTLPAWSWAVSGCGRMGEPWGGDLNLQAR